MGQMSSWVPGMKNMRRSVWGKLKKHTRKSKERAADLRQRTSSPLRSQFNTEKMDDGNRV